MVGAVLLGLLWRSGAVGGRAFSAPPSAPMQDPSPLIGGDSISETDPSSYTRFLPLISKNLWTVPSAPYGVQIYGSSPSTALTIAQMGARWVRIPLKWSSIEPTNTTPDHYWWSSSYEAGLAQLAARNVRIILTLSENPSWAATYRNGPIDKASLSELAEFVVAAVKRYSGPPYYVKYWEFYNEPDNGVEHLAETGSSWFGTQPQAYVDLLKAVYQPIKEADPEAQVVLGGLAYDWFTEAGGPFVEDFLDEVLTKGGGNWFDVMNFHYYPTFRPNWEAYGIDIIGKANYLRNKLAGYGWQKPLICTEAGFWSDSVHDPPGNHELQSRYVPQLFVRSQAADLGLTIWFMLIDLDGWKVGLFTPDMQPKPAHYAYSTLARQLSSARYVRTLSLAEIGSAEVEAYEYASLNGSRIVVAWRKSDGPNHRMMLAGSQAVVVDKYGAQTTVYDGDDGYPDGRVTVTITASPVYIRIPY
ncbi:MAG: cellulase family glycosylhydrolase [Anaerolineae bacterium]